MSRKRKRKGTQKRRSKPGPEPVGLTTAAPPESAAESPSSDAPVRRLTPYDHVRENLEALIVAIILAVIIRQFAVEAFEIPTGSMAPTLYGIHAWTGCPNCDTEYNIALRTDQDSGKIAVLYDPLVIYDGPCKNPDGCGMQRHFRAANGDPLSPGSRIECAACGASFQGDARRYRRARAKLYTSRCPNCHFVFSDVLEHSKHTGGHKILVNKFAYAVGSPERWDVIVFTFDQWKNYIKRLVGLPGEQIDLWDGDVYVDGKIERKYKHPYIQGELWVRIADSSVPERGLRGHAPAWKELAWSEAGPATDRLARWNDAALRWSVNAAAELAVLEYERPFDNFYNYNLLQFGTNGYPSSVEVGDKRVEFVVSPLRTPSRPAASEGGDGSWVGAEIRDGEFTFQVRLPIGRPDPTRPAVLERMTNEGWADGAAGDPRRSPFTTPALRATAAVALEENTATPVAFENVDDRAAVFVDGELVLELEYTSLPAGARLGADEAPPLPSERGRHYLRLLVADSQVELSEIRVFRDMYYIGHHNTRTPASSNPKFRSSIHLAEGQYFALGDNGPSSSDGRYWRYVPESHLMGKALSVFWPAWPTNFQCKFIR